MFKRLATLAMILMLSSLSSMAISAGQPGTTETVFNKKFIYRLKPMMAYEQLTKIIGVEGKKVGEEKGSSSSKMMYHWDGERKSALDVKVVSGKMVDVTVTTPKKKKYSLGKKGELVGLDD